MSATVSLSSSSSTSSADSSSENEFTVNSSTGAIVPYIPLEVPFSDDPPAPPSPTVPTADGDSSAPPANPSRWTDRFPVRVTPPRRVPRSPPVSTSKRAGKQKKRVREESDSDSSWNTNDDREIEEDQEDNSDVVILSSKKRPRSSAATTSRRFTRASARRTAAQPQTSTASQSVPAHAPADAPVDESPAVQQGEQQNAPASGTTDNTLFKSPAHAELWKFVSARQIVAERTLHAGDFRNLGILELLNEVNWLGTVTKVRKFVKLVVYEFYTNLSKSLGDPGF